MTRHRRRAGRHLQEAEGHGAQEVKLRRRLLRGLDQHAVAEAVDQQTADLSARRDDDVILARLAVEPAHISSKENLKVEQAADASVARTVGVELVGKLQEARHRPCTCRSLSLALLAVTRRTIPEHICHHADAHPQRSNAHVLWWMTGRSMSCCRSSSNTRRLACSRLTPGAMFSSSITGPRVCSSRLHPSDGEATRTSDRRGHLCAEHKLEQRLLWPAL